MNPITLTFATDGTIQGLYTEAIEFTALGRLRITRASAVEFDNPAQVWRVFDPKGRGVYSSPSRQACLDWEHQYFNR